MGPGVAGAARRTARRRPAVDRARARRRGPARRLAGRGGPPVRADASSTGATSTSTLCRFAASPAAGAHAAPRASPAPPPPPAPPSAARGRGGAGSSPLTTITLAGTTPSGSSRCRARSTQEEAGRLDVDGDCPWTWRGTDHDAICPTCRSTSPPHRRPRPARRAPDGSRSHPRDRRSRSSPTCAHRHGGRRCAPTARSAARRKARARGHRRDLRGRRRRAPSRAARPSRSQTRPRARRRGHAGGRRQHGTGRDPYHAVHAQLRFANFLAVSRPGYEAATDGALSIEGALAYPGVRGDLTLTHLLVRPAVLTETSGPSLEPDPTIEVVGLRIPAPPAQAVATAPASTSPTPSRSTSASTSCAMRWIRRNDADVELRGDLRLGKAAHRPLFVTGEIRLVRGRYAFQGRRFDVDEGRIIFGGEVPPIRSSTSPRSTRPATTRSPCGSRDAHRSRRSPCRRPRRSSRPTSWRCWSSDARRATSDARRDSTCSARRSRSRPATSCPSCASR